MTTGVVNGGLRGFRLGRSGAAELAGLVLFGAFLAAISAYGGEDLPVVRRYLHWQLALVGGGVIAALIEPLVARHLTGRPRLYALAQLIAMTPPISLWVSLLPVLLFGERLSMERAWALGPSVLTINIAVVGLAWLNRSAMKRPPPATPPQDVAPPEIRARLSPRLARSTLIAVEAEDHYLRVRTEAGSALILMRFADALAALTKADGFRTHRSWWVARKEVERARWRAGRGELALSDGSTAPVSRTYAATLKDTDWAAPA